jgi:hypothetical protein
MSNKIRVLFDILKDGNPVKFDDILTGMNSTKNSVMVFICTLRNEYGAEIETIREGRKANQYVLKNASEIQHKINSTSVKKHKKTDVVAAKVVKTKTKRAEDGSIPILDDDLHICDYSDHELSDIKSQLGLI